MSVYSIATLLQNSIYGYTEPMKNITSLNQGPTLTKEKLYQIFIERVAFGHIRVGSPWARGKGKYFGRPFSKYLSMNIGIEPGFMHIEIIFNKEPYREVYRIPYSEEAV